MLSELVESLRCPRAHEPAALIAVSYASDGREIVRGALGCPACGAEFAIDAGVADLRDGAAGIAPPPAKTRPADERALRAGALLGLADGAGLVVLAGAWAEAAPELAALAESVRLLAFDAPAGVAGGDGLSLARTAGGIPLLPARARGIALDAPHADARTLAEAAAALAPRGRLVAPATCAVPDGLSELARDAADWVAERLPTPAVIKLERRMKG